MKDRRGVLAIVVAIVGLGLWARKEGKLPIKPPIIPPVVKPPITETPSIPLDVWQGLTSQQLATLPVTQQKGAVGTELYNKTSRPIAIGDTGFSIWGTTESGATVVSMNPPETYDDWEWMF